MRQTERQTFSKARSGSDKSTSNQPRKKVAVAVCTSVSPTGDGLRGRAETGALLGIMDRPGSAAGRKGS
jgi:hypothetical protein